MQIEKEAKLFYESCFKDVLKAIIQENLEHLAFNADINSVEKLAFAKGTLNGLSIIEEWFKEQNSKCLAEAQEVRTDNEDVFNN